MPRWRVVLEVEHPDASSDEVSEWLQGALDDLRLIPGWYAAVDELESMDEDE